MLYHQIPALLYSLTPKFEDQESVKLTHSQFNLLSRVLSEYCHTHDAPRLKSLLKRIIRRINDKSPHHLWLTEFEFICNYLMKLMIDNGYCREEDNFISVQAILQRQSTVHANRKHNLRASDQVRLFSGMKQAFKKVMN